MAQFKVACQSGNQEDISRSRSTVTVINGFCDAVEVAECSIT